eukprot:2904196-Heterocapsa_arctica.AAC.1
MGASRLQHKLVMLADACVATGLVQRASDREDWEQHERLQDLADPECSHDWLWAICSLKAKPLCDTDFVTA